MLLAAGMASLGGCAGSGVIDSSTVAPPGSVAPAPISVQIIQASPELKGVRFYNLLNFEARTDTVFTSVSNLRSAMDDSTAHSGRTSLRLSGASGKITVKLSSLLGSTQKFPGEWTLIGAYFTAKEAMQVSASCEIGTTTLAKSTTLLQPGQWMPVLLDLTNILDPQRALTGPASITFSIESAGSAEVWCDDLVLIDNTQWIIGTPEASRDGRWTVAKRGMSYVSSVPDQYALRLSASDMQSNGWKVEEANGLRVRFSSTGKDKQITLFPDGRSYWDGSYRPLASELRREPIWADQQNAPAQIDIPETLGKLNRRSAGDANNDGFNEIRAAYTIQATGPRLEATITPRSTPVLRPMLEITDLPAGSALVTVEGRLVEKTLRLPDGTLLVEIPGKIDRATTVNVRVQ